MPHEPAPQVDDLDAVPVGCFVTGFGDDSLGIRVANLPQGRDLSLEGAFLRDVVAHLDIEALSLLGGYEVNLFLVENADVYLPTSSHQLDRDHVLVDAPEVEPAGSELRVTKRMVGQIVLVAR